MASHPLTVAVVHYEGDDYDCIYTILAPTATDCCNMILAEILEAHEEDRKFAENNGLAFSSEAPKWDGSDEDWLRLCKEQGMMVLFHNHKVEL